MKELKLRINYFLPCKAEPGLSSQERTIKIYDRAGNLLGYGRFPIDFINLIELDNGRAFVEVKIAGERGKTNIVTVKTDVNLKSLGYGFIEGDLIWVPKETLIPDLSIE